VQQGNHMFELGDLLVGVYKTFDQSKSLAIDPTQHANDGDDIDRSKLAFDIKPLENATRDMSLNENVFENLYTSQPET
jgi:hypothetical protein